MMAKAWKVQCPWCTARNEVEADEVPTVCDKCGRFVLVGPVAQDCGEDDANAGAIEKLDERQGH